MAESAIAQAGAAEAAIVCFPECFVPGYRWPGRNVPLVDQRFLEAAWARAAKAASRAGVAVILGTDRIVAGQRRMSTVVIDRVGAILGFQDKVQLDPSEEASGAFEPGTERRVFSIGDLTFGIAICHEGFRYPETVRWAARNGAQIVFHPFYDEATETSARPSTYADPTNTFHEKALLCRAAENTIYVASVNCASKNVPMTSAIIRPDGSVLSFQPYGVEGLLVADIDLKPATRLLAMRLREPVTQ